MLKEAEAALYNGKVVSFEITYLNSDLDFII